MSAKSTEKTIVILVLIDFFLFQHFRYDYLSYEFICTVQWEYSKPYSIFLCVTCFVTPLIVTVLCYASVMKVACYQARERPTATVGEIEAEGGSYLATCNRSNDIPDVNNSVMENGELRRAECTQENVIEKTKEKIGSSNINGCNSLKALAKNNGNVVVVTAEINTQMDSQKKAHEEVKGTVSNGSKQEPNVSGSSDANGLAILSKTSTELENILKRLPNVTRVWDERAVVLEKTVNFRAREKKANKMNRSFLTQRNVSINPASAMSRENPAHFRPRGGWTRKDSFGPNLGIITEEKESKDLQESQMSAIKARTTSLGHLARVREWMGVRLMNKEKTETILKRK